MPPLYPSIFIKPSSSVASSDEDIPIPKVGQENQCEYGGELSIVIGKTARISARKTLWNMLQDILLLTIYRQGHGIVIRSILAMFLSGASAKDLINTRRWDR